MKYVFENRMGVEVDGELSDYIKQYLEGYTYGYGAIESVSESVDRIEILMAAFIEMLVDENIITINQVEKIL